jgi:Xaa-Pro aminopeptidase
MDRKEEILIKEERTRSLMKSLGLRAVLLKRQSNFSWFTAGGINMVPISTEIGFSSLLITETDKFCMTTRIEAARNMEEENLEDFGFTLLEQEWFEPKELKLVKKVVPTLEVGCDIPLYGLKDISEDMKQIRYSLIPPEIERYLWLGEKTSEAIESVLMEVKPGDTEAQVTGELTRRLWQHRIDQMGFQAAADERAYKYRHPIPTEKKIDKYLMLCVMSRKWGLITTITRIIHFGKASEKLMKQYKDNVFIECSMIAATRPGVVTSEIFKKACHLYDDLGYKDEWKLHHQGGAIDYDIRNYICTSESKDIVHKNQAFCWNPSISGTKSEDAFIGQEDGFVFITRPVKFPILKIEIGGFEFIRPKLLER